MFVTFHVGQLILIVFHGENIIRYRSEGLRRDVRPNCALMDSRVEMGKWQCPEILQNAKMKYPPAPASKAAYEEKLIS
ncbi:hypothetical protein M514_13201 [Trichuris suis]|uniref:Uncharacterized protein n=1 Tax=Trichuris suis TaxID=68888 RepID=A0A085LLS0_9BILA|nr:hypothetical protein M513_13201 [Trichuris suis]KFD59844.1 hypothetical protein M514_13201 [Trichuris suis]